MQAFLERSVEHLHKTYGDGLNGLCIVLPNRRAGLFFKKYLAKSLSKPSWAPIIYSSEDFILELSGLRIADPLSQLFTLYDVYKKEKGDEAERFDEFCRWGQVLLNDFGEADSYLAETERLFTNLADIKEIENWSLNREELTEFQKKYIRFWDSIGIYYSGLKESLLSKKLAYKGLAFRIAAERLAGGQVPFPWKKAVFLGFNALTKAEERIIRQLVSEAKAEVLWDADAYYTQHPEQEAGMFIRRYRKEGLFGSSFLWEEENLGKELKKITIIGVPKNIAQARAAGDLVKQHALAEDDTAMVLADESLLFPVLHSLPEEIKHVNVTMGYPMRNTPVHSLFDALLRMHEGAARFKRPGRFYHKDLLRVLNHPYIIAITGGTPVPSRRIAKGILERNLVFASLSDLKEKMAEGSSLGALERLLGPWHDSAQALDELRYLLDVLREHFGSKAEAGRQNIELEYLLAFSKVLKRLKVMTAEHGFSGELKTLRLLLNQLLRSSVLPFFGEPLKGLQVMGMLETRALDFKNVILLSANENILPSGRSQLSFIPYDLKKAFGLPTYSDRDAIFAYHFYRLLQRAETIFLLYNTETDTFGNGEQSRFITQLLTELPARNPKVTIERMFLSMDTGGGGDHPIEVPKTKEVMAALEKKAAEGFSPSLLARYISCPLQFYFHAAAGLREADEVEEDAGADTLGNVVHEVLLKMYEPFTGKEITAKQIRELIPQTERMVNEAFGEYYRTGDLGHGKNLLAVKVACRFVSNFLRKEAELLESGAGPLAITELEKELQDEVTIKNKPIRLIGRADRIDRLGGALRIIDYKTGKAAKEELEFEEWEELRSDSRLAKSFQLLMYAYLYRKNAGGEAVSSGIVSFRELGTGLKTVSAGGTNAITTEVTDRFAEELRALLGEIWDTSKSFTQTDDLSNCTYCSFRQICNR